MTFGLHLITMIAIGPFAFIVYFINDPALDIMITEFRTFGHWHFTMPDYKLLPLRFAIYLHLILMFLHAYTCYLMFITYCDISNRLIKFIHALILQMGGSNIINKRIIDTTLTNVCKMYTEQKVLNLVLWEMLYIFSLSYIVVIVPFLIACIYICIRFSQLITWFLYFPSVFTTGILAICAIFILIYASCLHEQSCRLLESCQKTYSFQDS